MQFEFNNLQTASLRNHDCELGERRVKLESRLMEKIGARYFAPKASASHLAGQSLATKRSNIQCRAPDVVGGTR